MVLDKSKMREEIKIIKAKYNKTNSQGGVKLQKAVIIEMRMSLPGTF